MNKVVRYSPEIRERAVRLVLAREHEHSSRWSAIKSIASKIGCTAETLRSWILKSETDQGIRPSVSTDQAERLRSLEREIRELRRSNEILRKAAVFLPRRSSTAG